jgi:peptide/nickel transport system ATP-binding protein/oligopeptide transport system ATP-binding protein
VSLVRIRNLNTWFPVRSGIFRRRTGWVYALNDIDLNIESGEVLALVGESGCGKSTLGNSLLGLVLPTSGTIEFDGRTIDIGKPSSWNDIRTDLQIIFQDPYSSLNPRHTVFQILAEPLLLHRQATRKNVREKVAELLSLVRLPADCMDRYPHAFSGGQRQRIGIARAIGLRPKLIVCDEVTSALDVSVQAQIVELLLDLKKKFALSLLFITHDLSLVRHIADRVAVMYAGRIVEMAPVEKIFDSPAHPYTRALLDAIPVLDRNKKPILLEGEVPSATVQHRGCVFQSRCAHAQDRCRSELPPAGDPEKIERVACFYPLRSGAAAERSG